MRKRDRGKGGRQTYICLWLIEEDGKASLALVEYAQAVETLSRIIWDHLA
jgi:hypothetical protein